MHLPDTDLFDELSSLLPPSSLVAVDPVVAEGEKKIEDIFYWKYIHIVYDIIFKLILIGCQ